MKDIVAMTDGTVLVNVHTQDQCAGHTCCIHNPSPHHMATWKHHWDDAMVQMMRECRHGYLHPDPDDLAYKRRAVGEDKASALSAHACDACCQPTVHKELEGSSRTDD